MDRLNGKKAVVIGSGTGIGRTVSFLFAKEGADVLIADHPSKRAELDSLAAEIRQLGREALCATVDVRREQDVKAAVDQAHAAFGRLDVLLNDAGISLPKGPFHERDADSWNDILAINLVG